MGTFRLSSGEKKAQSIRRRPTPSAARSRDKKMYTRTVLWYNSKSKSFKAGPVRYDGTRVKGMYLKPALPETAGHKWKVLELS